MTQKLYKVCFNVIILHDEVVYRKLLLTDFVSSEKNCNYLLIKYKQRKYAVFIFIYSLLSIIFYTTKIKLSF